MTTWQRRSTYGLEVDTENWYDRAACKGYDTSWWELRAGPRTAEYFRAHRICARCPVWQQCFDMAVATQSVGHIFGGIDFADRPKQAGQPTRIERCPICSAHFVVVNNRHRYCSQRCRYIGEATV